MESLVHGRFKLLVLVGCESGIFRDLMDFVNFFKEVFGLRWHKSRDQCLLSLKLYLFDGLRILIDKVIKIVFVCWFHYKLHYGEAVTVSSSLDSDTRVVLLQSASMIIQTLS